jgi:hypothetical protein
MKGTCTRCSHRPLQRAGRSKDVALDRQLVSCQAERDLVLARAREPSKQHNGQGGPPNRHFETPQHPTGSARFGHLMAHSAPRVVQARPLV